VIASNGVAHEAIVERLRGVNTPGREGVR
jgi:hypothetical protein